MVALPDTNGSMIQSELSRLCTALFERGFELVERVETLVKMENATNRTRVMRHCFHVRRNPPIYPSEALTDLHADHEPYPVKCWVDSKPLDDDSIISITFQFEAKASDGCIVDAVGIFTDRRSALDYVLRCTQQEAETFQWKSNELHFSMRKNGEVRELKISDC